MAKWDTNMLFLDADLDFDRYSLQMMYEKMEKDSEIIGPKLIQTFKSNVYCIHSSISAGFLFATKSQLKLLLHVADYIENALENDRWSWGLDPAALVIGAKRYGMNFIFMPCLVSMTSESLFGMYQLVNKNLNQKIEQTERNQKKPTNNRKEWEFSEENE